MKKLLTLIILAFGLSLSAQIQTITLPKCETVTAISYNPTDHTITYTDEDGDDTILTLDVGSLAFSDASNELTFTRPDGTTQVLDLSTLDDPFTCTDLNACDITALSDVSTTAPTDNQILVWDDATGEYVPEDLPAGAANSTLVVTETFTGGVDGDSLITTTYTYTGTNGTPVVTTLTKCNSRLYVDGGFIVHVSNDCSRDSINLVCPAP